VPFIPGSAVAAEIRQLQSIAAWRLLDLDAPTGWSWLKRILHLHAVADHACASLGMSPFRKANRWALYYNQASVDLLEKHHTLSTFPTDRIRVLPKTRTPQSGITLRSLSHHACVETADVDVKWIRHFPPTALGEDMRLRLLLFPWPFSITSRSFAPVRDPVGTSGADLPEEKFGYFDYHPEYDAKTLDETFSKTLEVAIDDAGDIDGVVLPESALTEEEFDRLWIIAEAKQVHFLLAGVRAVEKSDPLTSSAATKSRSRARNTAFLRVKGIGADAPQTYEQDKHHRWYLDRSQIEAYGLGHVLNPGRRWWENSVVGRRTLNVVAFNDWLTLCHLVCEDLARIDPVSRVVRAIGPTLVIAILLDGPQLEKRWPARYATVLADDPGSSVLTLTSLGMAKLSRPKGTDASRCVAMWKDSRTGYRAIELDPEATGVVLSLWGERVEEFAADGRSDGTMAGRIIFGDERQVLSPRRS
jgi:hypothetical protein